MYFNVLSSGVPRLHHHKFHLRLGTALLGALICLPGLWAPDTGYALEPTPAEPTKTAPTVSATPRTLLPEFIVTFDENFVVPEALDAGQFQAGIVALTLNRADTKDAQADLGVEFVRALGNNSGVFALRDLLLPEAADTTAILDAMAAQIAASPQVATASPVRIERIQQIVDDPRFSEQWHLTDPATGANVTPTWETSKGMGVRVAVLDTGYVNHVDLRANIPPGAGYDFVSRPFIGNDGDGRDNDAQDPGDWVESGDPSWCGPPSNSSWHGTHVAGTIAAVTDNAIGVAGVAPKAEIIPIRVLGKCGGASDDIADAIRWAAGLQVPNVPDNKYPAKVINLSLGGPSSICPPEYQGAINDALGAGATIVVAAGNSDTEVSGFAPANCPGVITVAATNRAGDRSYYSNTGMMVDIAAPGGETYADRADGVLSTLNTGTTYPVHDNYAFYQGTSMAAPHVAGVAALVHAMHSGLASGDVLNIMQQNAKPFPRGGVRPCDISTCGAGILDASAATEIAAETSTHTLLRPGQLDAGWVGIDNQGSTYSGLLRTGIEDQWLAYKGDGTNIAIAETIETDEEFARLAALPDMAPWSGAIGPQKIIGADDRQPVSDTSGFPERAQVLVVLPAGRCSGALIGPDLVLTAGHCVHSGGPGGQWMNRAVVYPGRNGPVAPFGSCQATRLYSVKGWTENRNPAYDFGAIKLNCDIGSQIGWLGYFWRSGTLVGTGARISSYPGDKPLEQWTHTDLVRSNSALQAHYRTDTVGGNSGSAVFASDVPTGCGYCAHTVHAYGGTSFNAGTRITEQLFNNLRAWSDAPKN